MKIGETNVLISPIKINTKNATIKESINIQIPKVIQWFIESEQCMLGANAVLIPITESNFMETKFEKQQYIQQMPKGECTYCDLEYDKPTGCFPPHTASPRCQSGHHNHCTCDTCF